MSKRQPYRPMLPVESHEAKEVMERCNLRPGVHPDTGYLVICRAESEYYLTIGYDDFWRGLYERQIQVHKAQDSDYLKLMKRGRNEKYKEGA